MICCNISMTKTIDNNSYAVMSCENYDPCFPDQPVVDRYLPIWANLPAFHSKPAFVWAHDSPPSTTWSSITYSELESSVQAVASSLQLDLRRGDTVLILCPPGLQLVKTLFACQRAGLVAVPIVPPNLSDLSSLKQTPAYHHLLRVLSQTCPKAAIADRHFISSLNLFFAQSAGSEPLHKRLVGLRWLPVEKLDDHMHKNSCCMTTNHCENYSGCSSDEPYLIQYTSGATGIPKPVIVTAGAAAHNVRAARKAYDLQPSSMIVSWLPQYHDCGLMFLLLTVVSGATCVLTSPAAFLARPRIWLELITEFKATHTPVPSFALPLVAKRGGVDEGKLPLRLESLRNLILINEPIYKSLVEEFVDKFKCVRLTPASISPSYGLAENCTFVSTSWESNCFPDMPAYRKLLPSARLAAVTPSSDREDIEILVVNEQTCEPEADGVEGEIWVSSASNAAGYLGHPSLTREAFHARIRGTNTSCFVRTGDRGVIRGEERYLYIMGRASDVIRVNDHRSYVHPHYLETAAYNSDPMALRGGCIAAVEVAGAVVVVAELQKRGAGAAVPNYRSICERIRENVMQEEGVRVAWVVLVDGGSMPKTTSGKLRRFLVKDMVLKGSFPVVFKVGYEGSSLPEKEVCRSEGREAVEDEAWSFAGIGRRPLLHSFL